MIKHTQVAVVLLWVAVLSASPVGAQPAVPRATEPTAEARELARLFYSDAMFEAQVHLTVEVALEVGTNIQPPRKTHDVPPQYPSIAQASRVQGTVVIEATIDKEGNVIDAKVLRSIPLLDQAALDAVRQWKFTPTVKDGAPVSVIMTTTVQFSLK
jgi:TonB family protein